MTRLIDADALKETIGIRLYSGAVMEFVSVEDIAKQPTVDAVPVIRCKDCKYWHESNYRCTNVPGGVYRSEYDYCSSARKEE